MSPEQSQNRRVVLLHETLGCLIIIAATSSTRILVIPVIEVANKKFIMHDFASTRVSGK